MKTKTKKLIIDSLMYITGTLVLIFMFICIFAKQTWALYVEIALSLPFWSLVAVEIIIWINEKEGKNNETKK